MKSACCVLPLISAFVICFVPSAGTAADPPTAGGSHQDLSWFVGPDGTLQTVQNVSDWEQRRQAILAGMQQAMGPLPDRSDLPELDVQVTDRTSGDGYTRQTISLASGDGDRISADLYLPTAATPDNPAPGILALHPTGAAGKRIVAGEGPRVNRQYAVELAQRGYVVIAPDYPSFGDSTDYDFEADSYVSGTMKGIANHMRCVDLLQSRPDVDGDRLGVIGHSLGGHNAMFVAVFDPRLKVIVSSCGWTPFHDYYSGNITGWTSARYMPLLKDQYGLDPAKVPFDFYEVVAALAPRAFFSSSPVGDENFDVAGVRKAIPKAAEIYQLYDAGNQLQVRYPECDHDFPTETRSAAYEFIDSVLNHTPAATVDYAAELPRIPARSPAEALQSFELVDGFRIEQTAAEPLVTDPVAMSFDADSRLYVAEMKDYSEQENDFLGQVRVLEDTTGDGLFDRSTVFAEGLSWPTAIVCFDGGVFVGAPPDIHYLKDTDGDRVADERRVVLTGFGRSNVQGLLNSLRWGLDNRIHGAASSSGGLVRRPDQPDSEAVDLRGHDFSFDPRTFEVRAESGGAQHGMSFDDWGRKFVSSNSDHAQMVVYDERYTNRNPALNALPPRIRIAVDGGQAEVFRISQVEPWRIVRTRLRVSGQVKGIVEGGGRAAGYFTGATGITIYRGHAWPQQMRGMAFIADVGSNIVHRKKLNPDGVVFQAVRIDEGHEFLASSDVWFRPVQFANAPDGCLHILDMYRETIEHPKSLPPEIKQHLDLTSGRDRGRLYRVVPEDFQGSDLPNLSSLSGADLVQLLNHQNGWHRDTAARLLFERQDASVVDDLHKFVLAGTLPQGRMQALYVLDGLQQLAAKDVWRALADPHPRVREHALKFSERFADVDRVRSAAENLLTDNDPRVRFQLALSAGEFAQDWRDPVIAQLLQQDAADRWIVMAALSSLSSGAADLLKSLLANPEFRDNPAADQTLGALASLVLSQASQAEVQGLADWLTTTAAADGQQAESVLQTLLLYAPDLANRLQQSAGLQPTFDSVVSSARQTAGDDSAEIQQRVRAVRTLAATEDNADIPTLLSLLDARHPTALQQAAMDAVAVYSADAVAAGLIQRWPLLTPALQRVAEERLFSRTSWARLTLSAIADGRIKAAEISASRWSLLMASRDARLREAAEKLQQQSQNSSRAAVVAEYQPALQLAGDPERGQAVFRKTCAACHRMDDFGHEIGPNLATIRNRGREAILLNVLDPNREVNPQFAGYVAITTDGLTHTGMIASESATVVTLKRAENQTSTLLRQDLEEFRNTGLSLMPEGMEKDIDVQAMADLLSYLLKP